MADEILTATESFEFATTLLGRPRNEAAGSNQLKEQSGVSLGAGLVLTDSRFLTVDNGGPTAPGDLSVHRGATIGGTDGTLVTADSIVALSSESGDHTEIALVTTSDTSAPLIGMVVYADPNEAAGALTMTGYSRSDDAAAARAYDFNLTAGAYETTTLKNRTETNDVWLIDYDPNQDYFVSGGAGLYQNLDIDGDGTGTWYAAALLVGPYVPQSATDFRFAADPMGDIYFDLAVQLQALGVSADEIGRNALIASSTGGLLEGTYLNEDFMGSAAADTLVGNGGEDLMVGGAGADSLDAGAQSDTLFGGDGADTLRGRGGADEIEGGADSDLLISNGGADIVRGDAGNDTIRGGGGADSLFGGAGDDVFNGGNGADSLFGGGGADRLDGRNGVDELTGDSGADVFVFTDGDAITDMVLAEDRIDVSGLGVTGTNQLKLTTVAPGEVTIKIKATGEIITALDGDGVADFRKQDFDASDFIFA